MSKEKWRILLVLSMVFLLAGPATAEEASSALQARADGLSMAANGATVEVSLAGEDLLRVTATLDGVSPRPLPDAMTIRVARRQAAPVRETNAWRLGPYSLRQDGPALVVAKDGQTRFRIRFEKAGAGAVRAPIVLEKSEALYGMGQCAKSLALGEQYFYLYNRPAFGDQTYLYVPYFFGSAGDAFLFEAAGKDIFTFKNSREATPVGVSGRIDLLYWQDPDPVRLTSRFYTLTEARSLLPQWSYGFIQSRYGYRTDAEVRAIVGAFGRLQLPLSAIVLDLYWFNRMGDLDWNRQAFPDPTGLDSWLEKVGVKLITITEPFYTLDSKLYDDFAAAGLFAAGTGGGPAVWNDWWTFGGTGGSILNPLAPQAETLLEERYVAIARSGVDGFWTDLGEPENVPSTARFGAWSEAEFHQAYNKEWSRLVHDAWEKAFPGKRPFILSRSGYLGSSGYGVSIWSGDVPASWDGLRAQVPLGLQAGLSGFPFWGSDAGGFITSGGDLVPPDPELYLRWLQFSAFTPIFRAHGMGPREPWIYGEEWLRRTAVALVLRATILPYLYSTAYQVWSTGIPMMRPLFFLDSSDPRLTKEDSSFLLGDWILVSPVTKPLSAATTRKVYLPRGTWYDVFTMQRYDGGREIDFPLTLETFPAFAREGAIIPVTASRQEAYLLLPGSGTSSYTSFRDDGTSEAYRTGAGERLQISLDATGVSFGGAESRRDVFLLLPKAYTKLNALAGAVVAADDQNLFVVRVTIDKSTKRYDF